MTNRREFIQVAAALPVAASASGTAASVSVAPTSGVAVRPLALHAVLVDPRHAQSRSFGARLAARGAAVHGLADGDVTQLWLREIGPAWRRSPVSIAGLTARPALFCLEQLAFASGLRVVYHAEHVLYATGETQHALLRGGQASDLTARELARHGAAWGARVADAVAAHGQAARCERAGPSCASLEPPLPEGAQLLTSWIIAAA